MNTSDPELVNMVIKNDRERQNLEERVDFLVRRVGSLEGRVSSLEHRELPTKGSVKFAILSLVLPVVAGLIGGFIYGILS